MANRKYEYKMEKSEWEVPSLKVGDIAVVLHSYFAKMDDARFTDLQCGDTTVVEVKRNGTVVLANNFKFKADGYGHACNAACVISKRHALKRTKTGFLPVVNGVIVSVPADKDGHFSTFKE